MAVSTLQTYIDGWRTLASNNGMEEHYTDEKLTQWANWAGKRVTKHFDWEWLKTAVKFAAEADQEWYNMDDSGIMLDGVFRVTSGPLATEKNHEMMSFQLFQEKKADQTVYCSAVLGRQVFLSPLPTAGVDIGLYGKKQWEDLTLTTDESIVPSDYDEAIIQYMNMYAQADGLNPEGETQALNNAVAFLDRMAIIQTNDEPIGSSGKILHSHFQ